MFFPGLYSKLNYLDWTNWTSFDPHLIYAFLGEDKFICVLCFEIIGEYSAAACTRSRTFLEQVITTTEQVVLSCFWPRTDKELNADLVEKKGHKSRLKLEMSAKGNWAANGSWLLSSPIAQCALCTVFPMDIFFPASSVWRKIHSHPTNGPSV